jgi:2-polyprenyl-3-methyl-5-hydroxy-6-metoxy-1,4-benzoquinol methylase
MDTKEIFGFELISPKSGSLLTEDKDHLISQNGEKFPIINNIPRFVPSENYASAFGLQWNEYKKTMADSFTGVPIQRDRLTRIAGGSLGIFQGKTTLEAGCGAGSFTEILLQSGANVFAADISSAVDVNYENCSKYPNYFIIQADILHLPIPQNKFDIVICIGVIQHTPDPEKTIAALCSYLKPKGSLFIDHYSKDYPATPIRRLFRYFLKNAKEEKSLKFVRGYVRMFWPLHKFFYKHRHIFGIGKLRVWFLYWSPIVDYQDANSALGDELLFQWAILGTYDTLTDFYKHLRSAEEIKESLIKNGMTEIEIAHAGNGIEARAVKASTNEPVILSEP